MMQKTEETGDRPICDPVETTFMENNLCRIALIQTSVSPDIGFNITRAAEKIRLAAGQGAQIVCLPELFSTPYFPQYIGLSISSFCESLSSSFIAHFRKIAAELQIVLIIPFLESGSDNFNYNSAVVIDADGSLFSPYHKVHIPQDPLFYEKGYFHPGNKYEVFSTRYADIAVLICYDQWFPEAARTVALMGAKIIFYPTAIGHIRGEIPGEGNWKEAWQLIQRSHAIANSVTIAAVNRCGWEDELFFFGGSFISDAFGTVIAEAGEDELVVYGDIDLSLGSCIREGWGFFRNRRADTYHPLITHSLTLDPSSGTITPANQGFHMPAEWEPHDAVWMAWPHNDLTFPRLNAVEETYIEIFSALHQSERIELFIPDSALESKILHFLKVRGISDPDIRFYQVPYSDVWIRDYGPTFVINRAISKVSGVSWEFNAWGDKYDELIEDGRKARAYFSSVGTSLFYPHIVMEGGSIDVNGRGLVLTTRQCLLNPNRNPSLIQEDIEHKFREYLCASKIIWLNQGIEGDDTDGHVDDIARFVNPGTVVCAVEDDLEDSNYLALHENYQILRDETDQDNKPLTIIPIPMPHPVIDDVNRYPATYLNFYISNAVVLVPVFDDPHDQKALEILQNLFPDRKVIGIHARAMVEGFGTIHCATQQQPRIDTF